MHEQNLEIKLIRNTQQRAANRTLRLNNDQ